MIVECLCCDVGFLEEAERGPFNETRWLEDQFVLKGYFLFSRPVTRWWWWMEGRKASLEDSPEEELNTRTAGR